MTNIKKFQKPAQHCFWVWYAQPIKGEAYLSVLAKTPGEALNMAKGDIQQVDRVFDCYTMKNYNVSRGTITN